MSETYRIVIADDEAIICMDLKEILEEAGHEVVGICADGVRALELVKEEKPDLVILDVQMPKLDGLQAEKRLPREDKQDRHDGHFPWGSIYAALLLAHWRHNLRHTRFGL